MSMMMLSCTKDVGCTHNKDYSGKYLVLVKASYQGKGEAGCNSSYFDTITVDAKYYPAEILVSPFEKYQNCALSGTGRFYQGFYEETLSNCIKGAHYNYGLSSLTLRNDSIIYNNSLGTNHSYYTIYIIGKRLN